MKKSFVQWRLMSILICSLICLQGYCQVTEGSVVVRPVESDAILLNPGMGFTTFQRFNGDTQNVLEDCCGDFQDGFPFDVVKDPDGNLVNRYYPQTTIAYFRFYWMYIEPEQGVYRWDIIDRALSTARERKQTLMLSLMPYGTEDNFDVPTWYREMVGDQKNFTYNNPVNKWLVDPEDPRYVEHYGGLIRALGQRYDGHPDLESVDIRIVGAWGEGGGTEFLTQQTARALIDAYVESFRKTPIKLLLTDEFSNKYAMSQADVGYRADCLGDLGFWATEQNGWTHMYDYYPQGIINFGVKDAWKEAPVSFEMCGTFPGWKEREGYGSAEVKYIFDQALKWHISSFNGKSTPIPQEYMPQVEEFLKKIGYRFVLRRFTYPKEIGINQKMDFTSWWENKGVAPCYKNFKLAIRLTNSKEERTFMTHTDIREWLPGDNVYNDAIFIPHEMKIGTYELQIAIVDPATIETKVQLAIETKNENGWYSLGKIRLK